MPCHTEGYYGPTDSDYEEWEHNSKLAEAVCELCQTLEEQNIKLTPKLQEWWEKHKKRDRQRLEAELKEKQKIRDRKEALEKLTPRERKLLGL